MAVLLGYLDVGAVRRPGTSAGGSIGQLDIGAVRRPRYVKYDAVSNSGYQAASSSYSWSHVCSGSDRFLAVDVSILSVPGTTVTGITYNGVAMTLIGAKSTVSGAGRVESWGLVAPAADSNTIAVTLSASVVSAGNAVSYSGVHQSTASEAFNSAQATNVGAADATVSVTTATDNDWVHGALATDDLSVTAGQVSRNNVSGAGGSAADEDTAIPTSPAGAVTTSYTGVGALATWAIGGYGIRPVSANGGNQTATSGTSTVTITGVAPSASGSGTGTVTPGAGTVTVTGVSPASSGTGTSTTVPGAATVTLTGVSPAASGTGTSTLTPGASTVTVSGASPNASGTGTSTNTPGVSTVTVSATSPAASGSGTSTSTPAAATATITGVSPTTSGSGTGTATPGIGVVTISASSPAASGAGTGTATPGSALVAVSGVAVSASGGGGQTASPGASVATVSGASPSVSGTGTATVVCGVGVVTITGASVLLPSVAIAHVTLYWSQTVAAALTWQQTQDVALTWAP